MTTAIASEPKREDANLLNSIDHVKQLYDDVVGNAICPPRTPLMKVVLKKALFKNLVIAHAQSQLAQRGSALTATDLYIVALNAFQAVGLIPE